MDFTQASCEDFISVLASKEPVPGGGGASALVAAVGVALGNMVGSLTVGKAQYVDVQDDIASLNTKARALENELLKLVDKDAVVFAPLSRAYGMPKDTEAQKADKARVMEACLRECCDVPLNIMKKCCKAIDLHAEYASKGTAIAISDVGCGVAICKAALQAASLNVFINTKSMQDRSYAETVNKDAKTLLAEYTKKADDIFTDVVARFE